MPSLTVENYAKAIYQLAHAADDGAVATGQIAIALGVLPGTVTSMLKTLDESNLATYTPYEGVRLTSSGQALAIGDLTVLETTRRRWPGASEVECPAGPLCYPPRPRAISSAG